MEEDNDGTKKLAQFDTYAKLVEMQRRQLEREIQSEATAVALTRRFIVEAEETQKEKLLRQNELEQRMFEREAARMATAREEQKLLQRIEKDEKSQVRSKLVNQQQQAKLQDVEEKKRKEEAKLLLDAKRAWMKHNVEKARNAEKLRREEIADKIREKQRKHELALIENAKAMEEKKKALEAEKEARLALTDEQEALVSVDTPREPSRPPSRARRTTSKSPRLRIMDKDHEERVKIQRAKREEQFERKQLLEKERLSKLEEQMEKKRQNDQRREQQIESLTMQRMQATARKEEQRKEALVRYDALQRENQRRIEEKIEEQKPTAETAATENHCEAAQMYMKIKTELSRRRDKMVVSKQWKLDELNAVIPPAGGAQCSSARRKVRKDGDGDDSDCADDTPRMDVGSARLQALYDQYVKDKPTPRDSINYDRLHGAKKQRVFGVAKVRCGLCEQDYVAENLPGITTRATITKLRRAWREQAGEEQKEERGLRLSGLYDKVALCALCFQFVQEDKAT